MAEGIRTEDGHRVWVVQREDSEDQESYSFVRPAQDDDVQGQAWRHSLGEDEDTEGQSFRLRLGGTEEDVEGHRVRFHLSPEARRRAGAVPGGRGHRGRRGRSGLPAALASSRRRGRPG